MEPLSQVLLLGGAHLDGLKFALDRWFGDQQHVRHVISMTDYWKRLRRHPTHAVLVDIAEPDQTVARGLALAKTGHLYGQMVFALIDDGHVDLAIAQLEHHGLDRLEGYSRVRIDADLQPTNLEDVMRQLTTARAGRAERPAGPPPVPFDIALSFAGEDRELVSTVAELLERRGVSIFYDRFHESRLLGQPLAPALRTAYERHARVVVVFSSNAYGLSEWTRQELAWIVATTASPDGPRVVQVCVDGAASVAELASDARLHLGAGDAAAARSVADSLTQAALYEWTARSGRGDRAEP